MDNEHEELIRKYQQYKDEVAEYEKKLYAYNSQIELYAKEVITQIAELKKAGINLDTIKKYADADGNIDLTDKGIVKGMINDLYEIYQQTVNEGLKILEDR